MVYGLGIRIICNNLVSKSPVSVYEKGEERLDQGLKFRF